MNPVVIVDGMILAYRQNHALGWMKTSKGEPTGLRFGMLRSLMSYQRQLNAKDIVIAWDMPGAIKKAEAEGEYKATTEYKANRVHTAGQHSMFDELPALREMLMKTKWSQLWMEGYEADDLIAAHAQNVTDPVVIITSDNDMHQLVTNRITVWPGNKEKTMTRQLVKEKWGVWPEQLALLRSVMGDTSDNLKPLLYGDVRVVFKTMLELNSNIQTVEEAFAQMSRLPIEDLGGDFWSDMRRRYRLMSPNIPTNYQIYYGQKDSEYLLNVFDKMESRSLSGQLHKMV